MAFTYTDVVSISGITIGQQLMAASFPVVIASNQSAVPISGTVAVTGALTDAQLRATPVPVSGTVAISGSVAVTGTFWQATQPVSGTFWQATQPVSGTFYQATQPVSIAALPALVASSAIIGNVRIDQTTPGTTNGVVVNSGTVAISGAVAVTGTFYQATQPVSIAATVTVDTELPAAAALADGASNPTAPMVGSDNMLFNGATWDRQRGNFNTSTGDSGNKVASFDGATQTNYNARGAIITLICGTVASLPSKTLTMKLQWSPDAGTTWYDLHETVSGAINTTGQSICMICYPSNMTVAGGTTASLAPSTTQEIFLNAPLPRTWRMTYVISAGGDFTITGVYVNYIL